MTTANLVEIRYYTVIAAADGVRVSEKALELAERLLAENKKRVEVGALAPLDEKQAEAEVATRKADLLSSRRLLEDQQNLLKGLLTDDYSSWLGVNLQPSARLTAVPVSLQLSDSWMVALSRRPEILEAKLNIERQDITIKYQQNQLYPQLDLVGSYGWVGGGDAREYSDVWKQWDSGDNPFFSLGAQLSIPLGNGAARNSLRAARVSRQQLLLGLKRLEQSIMVDVDNAIGSVRTAFERVQATREARIYAQAALEAEQKKLENGKSTSFMVLQFQRDLTAAASTEIRALADYNIALANLSFAEGTTLERNNLEIEVR
jgi:outer membrane protein TolC